MRAGETLTAVGARQAAALGIAARILPMTDDPVRTVVETDAGTLTFQEYFVRDQCRPVVRSVRFDGADAARPTPQVIEALVGADLAGIVIGPSNPWLSVDPILAVPGMREAMKASGAPIVAVSPIVGGKAVKGPTAKIMAELGLQPDSRAVARHYAGLIDGFVIDSQDEALEKDIGLPILVTNTLMRTLDDKIALARQCLAFCGRLAGKRRRGHEELRHELGPDVRDRSGEGPGSGQAAAVVRAARGGAAAAGADHAGGRAGRARRRREHRLRGRRHA